MKLQIFTGGLSTRLRPQYIGLTEGATYNNIDNSVGSLNSVAEKNGSGILTDQFAEYFEGTWLSSATRRTYAELLGDLYWTDGINAPGKFDGVTESNLGIIQPSVVPTTTTRAIDNPIESTVEITTGGNLPDEVVYYRLVNFDNVYYSGAYDIKADLANGTVELDTTFLGTFSEFDSGSDFIDGDSPISVHTTVDITDASPDKQVIISNVGGISYGVGGVLVFRQYKGIWRLLGALASDAAIINDSNYDISAQAALDETKLSPIAGTMQYGYTFYNATDGIESAISPISDSLQVLGSVSITGMEISTDAQVTNKRIYRVGSSISTFSLVDTIANAATVYTDDNKDDEIVGTILTSADYSAPITTLDFLVEAYAMLFAATGSRLYFTPIGKPDAWPSLNFLEFGVNITGIAPTGAGLLVFTEFKTSIVFGTSPTNLTQQPLSGDQGCIGAASIQVIGDYAIWASSDGLCVSNGGGVDVITRDKLGKVTLNPTDSIIFDEVYYLLEASGNILSYDTRFQPIFKNLNLGIGAFAVAEDVLYGWLLNQQYTLFTGNNLESMSFTSARMAEGNMTEEKTYKKIHISSKGYIMIKVLINDVLVLTKTLINATTKSEQFQIPHDLQRGEYIQYIITGTGEVNELEYVVGKSHND